MITIVNSNLGGNSVAVSSTGTYFIQASRKLFRPQQSPNPITIPNMSRFNYVTIVDNVLYIVGRDSLSHPLIVSYDIDESKVISTLYQGEKCADVILSLDEVDAKDAVIVANPDIQVAPNEDVYYACKLLFN